VGLAQLVVIVFGVVAVTSEYRTRMIRSSLAAVPTRLPLVWGKAVVVAAGTVVVSLAALLLSFLVAGFVLRTENLDISLTTPGVARALIGSALALGVTAALASGFGWLLRNTAAAVFALLAGCTCSQPSPPCCRDRWRRRSHRCFPAARLRS
jgi:ABC-2 type transport system permease protein